VIVGVKAINTALKAQTAATDISYATDAIAILTKLLGIYRGEGSADSGYVNVAVPIGDGYDVLLLAGYDRTLLGAGYLGLKNTPPDPVNIEAGKANTIVINTSVISPVWDGSEGVTSTTFPASSDFKFTGTTAPTTPIPADRVITAGLAANASTLVLTFNTSKLAPLINSDFSGTDLTVEDFSVMLNPRFMVEYPFNPIDFVETSSSSHGGAGPYPLDATAAVFTAIFGTGDGVTGKNIDGAVDFKLKYYAFGAPASAGTTLWIIRNGLGRAVDTASGFGGSFIVKFGEGKEPDANVTVNVK
jgi:hypothetical protein